MNEQQQRAICRAKELGVDEAIRIYAKAKYYNHSGHINYYSKFEGFEISATFGAGTNSATVQILSSDPLNPTILYSATDYGRYVSVFRYGSWVHRLIEEADRIRAANEIQREKDRILDEQRRAANYEEIDL